MTGNSPTGVMRSLALSLASIRATGLYEQFAGYHQLEPIDLSLYADRKVPIDVVIGRERTQRSQVIKQADVVALLVLLPDEFPGAMAERTSATTSRAAPMAVRSAPASTRWPRRGWATRRRRFFTCARPRLPTSNSTRTAAGGIRIAGLGGLWQAAVLGFAGLDLTGETISLNPRLPPQWRSMSFTARWRGRAVQVRIAGTMVRVTISEGPAVDIRIAGGIRSLQGGAALEVCLEPAAAAPS